MENTLQHHGILGMKWGVRRYQNADGTLTAAGKARRNSSESTSMSEDYKKAHSGKSVETMSDAELRSGLQRLQMEKQYNKLSDEDVNRGKAFVNKSLKVATGIATATTTAITIYNNFGKIKTILDETMKATS